MMTIREYGAQNDPVILLLHGGGLSWWNYRREAMLLGQDYHVILPVLDGHAESDSGFESIEAIAKRVIEYIDSHFGGQILALGGLSLGAQIAVEILAQRPEICSCALIESVSLIPSPWLNRLIGPTFSSSYFLVKYRWFSRLQFRSLHINEELFEDYYRDTCKIGKADMIRFLEANTSYGLPKEFREVHARLLVAVGEKEQRNMRRSAELLSRAAPGAKLYVAKGLNHGELSLNHPAQYTKLLQDLIEQ